jgi:HEAT repeat protein
MGILDKIFTREAGPSPRQLRRGLKQATQIHGEASTRVAALERLAQWRTPAAIAALLRRFTVQVAQGSMDLEEKQHTVRMLVEIGPPAVEPILHYLRTEGEVTWPARALREILSPEEFNLAIKNVLDKLNTGYARWPEAKSVLISQLPDEAFPVVKDTVVKFLADEDDDVCIAAADYLARHESDEARTHLLQTFVSAESRPRVRGRILDHFCEREWPVKGYRKMIEEAIQEPFYLTSRGAVKRRTL